MALVDLGAFRDKLKEQLPGLRAVLGDQGVKAVGFESLSGALDLLVRSQLREILFDQCNHRFKDTGFEAWLQGKVAGFVRGLRLQALDETCACFYRFPEYEIGKAELLPQPEDFLYQFVLTAD